MTEFIEFDDGVVINGDCCDDDTLSCVKKFFNEIHLIVTDPPYGIDIDEWDSSTINVTELLVEMLSKYSDFQPDGSAAYVCGGIGTPHNRQFFKFLCDVEETTKYLIANVVTWGKKRAYGVQHNYLFTREEIAYLVKGIDIKKPRVFNVPYTDVIRGYEGYNKKYPTKSPYKRRTSVWTDVTEIFRGKVHKTEKPQNLLKIMIETSSNRGDVVFDPFAGSGSTALAARSLERKFVVIERDKTFFELIVRRLS